VPPGSLLDLTVEVERATTTESNRLVDLAQPVLVPVTV
jgi:hypothetical protein